MTDKTHIYVLYFVVMALAALQMVEVPMLSVTFDHVIQLEIWHGSFQR